MSTSRTIADALHDVSAPSGTCLSKASPVLSTFNSLDPNSSMFPLVRNVMLLYFRLIQILLDFIITGSQKIGSSEAGLFRDAFLSFRSRLLLLSLLKTMEKRHLLGQEPNHRVPEAGLMCQNTERTSRDQLRWMTPSEEVCSDSLSLSLIHLAFAVTKQAI